MEGVLLSIGLLSHDLERSQFSDKDGDGIMADANLEDFIISTKLKMETVQPRLDAVCEKLRRGLSSLKRRSPAEDEAGEEEQNPRKKKKITTGGQKTKKAMESQDTRKSPRKAKR
jgi:hypothetical protein